MVDNDCILKDDDCDWVKIKLRGKWPILALAKKPSSSFTLVSCTSSSGVSFSFVASITSVIYFHRWLFWHSVDVMFDLVVMIMLMWWYDLLQRIIWWYLNFVFCILNMHRCCCLWWYFDLSTHVLDDRFLMLQNRFLLHAYFFVDLWFCICILGWVGGWKFCVKPSGYADRRTKLQLC